MQPLSQAVLLEAFPPHERGKAMGFWGLGIVVAPILGPVLGGWLTDTYSWRWVFYINLPVGIASLVMTQAVRLRSAVPAAARRRKIDYWGIGLLALWIGCAADRARPRARSATGSSSPFITGARGRSRRLGVVAFLVREWMRQRAGRRSAGLQGSAPTAPASS